MMYKGKNNKIYFDYVQMKEFPDQRTLWTKLIENVECEQITVSKTAVLETHL